MKELNIRPFRFWCHKVIPLIYDDSLSYYELLCKVVKYLNEVIENQNQANEAIDIIKANFETFKYYVEHYFDDLDVQDEIDHKLDEMAEDGTLADLIADYMPTSNESMIYPEYLASLIYEDGRFNTQNQKRVCSVLQCVCPLSANTAVGIVSATAKETNYNNMILFNQQTGIVSSTVTGEVGHGNDICTDGEYIYVAWDYEYEEDYTELQSNNISKFDLQLNLVEVIDPGARALALTYDPAEEKFYMAVTHDTIYVYNKDFSTLLRTFHLDYGHIQGRYYCGGEYRDEDGNITGHKNQAFQSIDFVNGYINVTYSYPCLMVRYDLNGNKMQTYNFPLMLANGGSLGEIECNVWDKYNHNYLGVGYSVMGLRDYDINSLYTFSLADGQVAFLAVDAATRYNLPQAYIYVDYTVGTNARMTGTMSYPFRFIQQAVDYIRMEPRPSQIIVRKLDTADDGAYGCVSIGNVSNLQITSYTTYENTSIDRYFIPIMHIEDAVNIEVFFNNIEELEIKKAVGIAIGGCRIKNITANRAMVYYQDSSTVIDGTPSFTQSSGYNITGITGAVLSHCYNLPSVPDQP